jgi:hypothetical protein
MRRGARCAVALAAALLLAGCMEVEQGAGPAKTGRYQGKPDTAPWSNAPLADGPRWTSGDHASWETEIKQRQTAQNEYQRIERQ